MAALLIWILITVPAVGQTETPTKAETPAISPAGDESAKPDSKQRKEDFLSANTVVFLGGTNTHGGEFIAQIEAMLLLNYEKTPTIINLGLPTETVTGLSEPSHPYPRPNLMDRLDSALEKTNPDFVFVSYGVDEGLYHPFDENRFQAFKKGIQELIAKANKQGAKVVLITPLPADMQELKKKAMLAEPGATEFSRKKVYENYDEEVIAKYAAWLKEFKNDDSVYAVIDAYSLVKQFISNQQEANSKFSYSADGFHVHKAAHRILAYAILDAFGFDESLVDDTKFTGWVRTRLGWNHMAWLTRVGHQHPRLPEGPSDSELKERLKPFNERIHKRLDENRKQ